MTAKRRLSKGRITHISLCRKGRNKLKTIMKSGDRFEIPLTLSKMDSQGLLYALVAAPEFDDTDGDVWSVEEIEKICHGFLANGGNIDVEHDLDPLTEDEIRICETLIVQKGDSRFSNLTYEGQLIDPTGSWGLVLKILDPELKAAYDSGEWDGVSLWGTALGTPLQKHQPQPETEVMDQETLDAIVKAVATATAEALKADREAEAQKQADLQKAQEDAKPKGLEFEGDPTSDVDVAKHLARLAVAQVDWNDPKSVEAYRSTLKVAKSVPLDVKKSEAKIADLKAEIAVLEKSSTIKGQDTNPDAESNKDAELAEACGLSTAEMEGVQLGKALTQAYAGHKDAKPAS